ncbi:MAG: MlaD family protein [Bacteroidia bacterium]
MNKFKVSNETLVGALAAVAITVLLLGFNFLKGEELFSTTTNYYVSYNDAMNLQSSASVMYRGIKVGSVRKVQFRKDGQGVIVQFYVNDRVKLPRGSEVLLTTIDLFNTRALELKIPENQESVAFYGKNDTLSGYVMSGMLDKLGDELSPLLANVEALSQKLDALVGAIEPQKIANSLESIERSTAGLDELLNSNNSRLNRMLDHVNSITKNFKENQHLLNAALANVEQITDSLAKSQLTATIAKAHESLEQTAAIFDKINKGEGSMGLLVNDKALYENLSKSSDSLDKLLADMQANPKRYVHFSLFGRKAK